MRLLEPLRPSLQGAVDVLRLRTPTSWNHCTVRARHCLCTSTLRFSAPNTAASPDVVAKSESAAGGAEEPGGSAAFALACRYAAISGREGKGRVRRRLAGSHLEHIGQPERISETLHALPDAQARTSALDWLLRRAPFGLGCHSYTLGQTTSRQRAGLDHGTEHRRVSLATYNLLHGRPS